MCKTEDALNKQHTWVLTLWKKQRQSLPKSGKKTLWFQCSVRKRKDFHSQLYFERYYSYATDCHIHIFHTYFSSVKILHPPNSDKVFPINRFLYHYRVLYVSFQSAPYVSLISMAWESHIVLSQYTWVKVSQPFTNRWFTASNTNQLLFRSYFCTALNPSQLLHVKASTACQNTFSSNSQWPALNRKSKQS